MRALWTQDRAEYHGEFVDFANCISRPRPAQGSVPIVVGGHTEAAAKRAGRLGDAFFPGSASPEAIAELTAVMQATAAEHGRDGDSIPVYAMCMGRPGDELYARIEGLAAVGVSQTIIATYPPDALVDIGRDLTSRFS